MAKQPDITNGMRAILVDWLVEVVQEFKLEPQTFYLSMSIVDRFLSCMSVLRSKLQLVGTASIYIAAKFEEIYPPEIADFVYITDDTYTKSQVQWNPSNKALGVGTEDQFVILWNPSIMDTLRTW